PTSRNAIRSAVVFKAKVLSLKNYPPENAGAHQPLRFDFPDTARAAAAAAVTPAPRNMVSLARMKKLAPLAAHLPTSSGVAQKMPAIFPRVSAAAMIESIALP